MKILHVFDCAAVACTLAKWQKKMGHEVYVHSFLENDPFDTLSYYGYPRKTGGVNWMDFHNKTFELAADYDVIHVHFIYTILPILRKKYPGKTLVMHYHGGDVRRAPDQEIRKTCQECADYVLAAHPEVHKRVPESQLLPTIIDTDLFHPIEHGPPERQFCVHWSMVNYDLMVQHIERLNIGHVELLKREDEPRPYRTMPDLFKPYGTYVNVIYGSGQLVDSLSKTALECLSCGLDVIDWEGRRLHGLPEKHRPENVVKSLPYMP